MIGRSRMGLAVENGSRLAVISPQRLRTRTAQLVTEDASAVSRDCLRFRPTASLGQARRGGGFGSEAIGVAPQCSRVTTATSIPTRLMRPRCPGTLIEGVVKNARSTKWPSGRSETPCLRLGARCKPGKRPWRGRGPVMTLAAAREPAQAGGGMLVLLRRHAVGWIAG